MAREFISDNPKLLSEWHPTKNGDLTPDKITTGSGKKVWWLCIKGHEWQTIIGNRAKGQGCPFCSGQRACNDNSLKTISPRLSKQWHPTKNGILTPDGVTISSGKKVWWQCEKGHEWQAVIGSRVRGCGCPYCSGRFATNNNSLQTLNTELSEQWHSTKNGKLTPNDVTTGSTKMIWWRCDKGHEWQATVANRTNGRGCPFCSGVKVLKGYNDLLSLNPDLAKQWHPTKNGDLAPDNVMIKSRKKVWWQCVKGHVWDAVIYSRANGNGCPDCNHENQTSFPEQVIYFYLKSVFNDTLNRYKYNNKWEIDVFVPSLRFGIEYDGIYYHENNTSDTKKDEYITNERIHLMRVKETKDHTQKCCRKGKIVYCNKKPTESQLNEVIATCFDYITENITHRYYSVDIDVKRDRVKIYDLFIKNEKEISFFALYPELSKQWHPTKNLRLKPDMIKAKTHRRLWWICEKGHEWEAMVSSRARGNGCPYCAGKRVCDDNSLQALNPDLTKQWHPTKNEKLTPNDVTEHSNKYAWWQCEKGHEWRVVIAKRTDGSSCPYCAGQRICADNCLQTLNPELSKQWHPIKNGILTPNDVTTGSRKKVWWQCERGHEWEAAIYSRKNGSDCPLCYKMSVKSKP